MTGTVAETLHFLFDHSWLNTQAAHIFDYLLAIRHPVWDVVTLDILVNDAHLQLQVVDLPWRRLLRHLVSQLLAWLEAGYIALSEICVSPDWRIL